MLAGNISNRELGPSSRCSRSVNAPSIISLFKSFNQQSLSYKILKIEVLVDFNWFPSSSGMLVNVAPSKSDGKISSYSIMTPQVFWTCSNKTQFFDLGKNNFTHQVMELADSNIAKRINHTVTGSKLPWISSVRYAIATSSKVIPCFPFTKAFHIRTDLLQFMAQSSGNMPRNKKQALR
ncbi:hypothetical protein V6N12_015069 [Hibiscus sabdariffa]|uniref:Uncharacterized protein n=1 Tax=Hibiscus sabdariffa TaxID=183260 RepID=A0ABR2DM23_9ROSI